MNNNETQKALSDLEALKQAVLSRSNKSPLGVGSVSMHKALHVVALIFVAGLITLDLPNHYLLTSDVMASAGNSWIQISGIITVGLTLLLLLTIGYGMVAYKAWQQKQELDEYITRYFTYFKNLSLFSDVVIKFIAFSAIILAGKPEWVAPALLLFTGDWVLQGRFFIIKQKLSLLLGAVCFIGAITMFCYGHALILVPLIIFLMIGGISLMEVLRFEEDLKSQDVSV
jgi:hypothetical protein